MLSSAQSGWDDTAGLDSVPSAPGAEPFWACWALCSSSAPRDPPVPAPSFPKPLPSPSPGPPAQCEPGGCTQLAVFAFLSSF